MMPTVYRSVHDTHRYSVNPFSYERDGDCFLFMPDSCPTAYRSTCRIRSAIAASPQWGAGDGQLAVEARSPIEYVGFIPERASLASGVMGD